MDVGVEINSFWHRRRVGGNRQPEVGTADDQAHSHADPSVGELTPHYPSILGCFRRSNGAFTTIMMGAYGSYLIPPYHKERAVNSTLAAYSG